MTRDEILDRYRRLRAVSKDHHHAALDFLPKSAILDYARRLGLAFGKTLVADSMDELGLAFDLALYSSKGGRSRAIDRYRRAARLPPGSDEAVMLDAMCRSHFSIWRVERRHETAGLVVSDLVCHRAEAWLIDESLEQTVPDGAGLAMRLAKPEDFSMTSGHAIPVDREIFGEVVDDIAPRVRGAPETVVDDPRFAATVYRVAIAHRTLAEPDLE